MRLIGLFALSIFLASPSPATAAECAADNRTRVRAGDECLVIAAHGAPSDRTKLVIFIHGDGSRGGPSDYLFKTAATYGGPGVVAIGLIRPGYFDADDNRSTGNAYRDGDGYRPDVVATVAAAVTTLKAHYKAARVVLAGHSGGAAISAVIMGKHPGLADAAVLAACPCNVPDWRIQRRGRNNWTESLSPHDFAATVAADAEIVALTGDGDTNTRSGIARGYIDSLRARGIKAEFIELPGVSHNDSARSDEFKDAVRRLLAGG